MAAIFRCILICTLIACALGHAVLVSPRPLNTNPTTLQKCGVNSYPANPTAAVTWRAGDTVTIAFRLVAGDGGNRADATLDVNGKTTFATAITSFAMDKGLATYDASFVVPDVTCSPICLFRVNSNTNWNSCAYVNITCKDCPPPPPPPPKCEPADGLTFCNGFFGNTLVIIPGDTTVKSLEANAKLAYDTYINNTNVFVNGLNSTTCQRTFREFICKQNLVPCPGSGKTRSTLANCRATCKNLDKVCATNPLHDQLYECDDATQFPLCDGENSAGLLSYSLFALFAVLFALLM